MKKFAIGVTVIAALFLAWLYIDYKTEEVKGEAYVYTIREMAGIKSGIKKISDKELNERIDARLVEQLKPLRGAVATVSAKQDETSAELKRLNESLLSIAAGSKVVDTTRTPGIQPDANDPDKPAASAEKAKKSGSSGGRKRTPAGPYQSLSNATVYVKGTSDVDGSLVTIASRFKKLRTNLKDGEEYDNGDVNAFANDIPALNNATSSKN